MITKRYIGYVFLALIAGAMLLLVFVMRSEISKDQTALEKTSRPVAMVPSQSKLAHLYFSDAGNQFLMAEDRLLKSPEIPEFFAGSIVEALIRGPQQGLTPTLPAQTGLRAIYLAPQGICYVDLTSAVTENHPGGIQSELLTIYSIVNSLVLNVSEIKAVKILINGNESETLAGHINLQMPIKANMLLIR